MAAEAVWLGLQRCRDVARLPRHCHHGAYAALVLAGGYAEAGDNGRHYARPGDVLIHGRFEAHQNAFGPEGADILNLPCPWHVTGLIGRVADPDRIMRIAEGDPQDAANAMFANLIPCIGTANDWPDMLAGALNRDEVASLSLWAEAAGITPASVSRGFALAYGTSPQRFRADRRACRAAQAIATQAKPLADMAVELGFADQAHMTREVSRLTGLSPQRWRTEQAKCVQDINPSSE